MTNQPTVSVLLPTYNRPHYLRDAIAGVLAQRFTDWELLVMNDGGVDVADVVAAAGDERVRYLHRAENRGKAACLNELLAEARGDYVAYLDDDDVWYPNHLETLAGALDENPEVGLAYSDLYSVVFAADAEGRRYPLEKRIVICRDFNRLLMFHFNHTLHVSLMHRRGLAERAGGYDEDVRVLIDWNLTRKLCFLTDFLHVQRTTGEYYTPVIDSDRISDLQRRDPARYAQNMRRIRADLPPEPWPKVRRVAVLLPVQRWDDEARATVAYFADKLDYPCRIALVHRDEATDRARRTLGSLAELKHLRLVPAPAGDDPAAWYRAGARGMDADCYYLAGTDACRRLELRLMKGLEFMDEAGCDVARWAEDDPQPGPAGLLVRRGVLFSGPPDGWPPPAVVPPGWLPPALETDLLLRLAEVCEQEGDYRGAARALERIGKLGEGSTGDPFLVQLRANVAFGLGGHDRAARMCEELIEAGCGADNWVRLGRIHQEEGRHRRALDAYEKGLAGIGLRDADVGADVFPLAAPADFDAFRAMVGRGECLLELGRLEEAARVLRLACRLRVNSARPYAAYGRLLLRAGDPDRAEESFRLAAERERPSADVSVELGLAEVCSARGQARRALQWCRRGLSRAPEDTTLLMRAAELAAALGRHEEQEALYRRFLEYRPGFVPALRGLADACRRLGKGEEARELRERADLLSGGCEGVRSAG
jgi:tetratricopeptide (TPR) repeat protein